MDLVFNPNGLIDKLDNTQVFAPTSKSHVHRLLIAASLADKKTFISCKTFSLDLKATCECLTRLGATITTTESGFWVSPIVSSNKRVFLNASESGTTARLILPIALALGASGTLTGSGKLPDRPFTDIIETLKAKNISITQNEKHLPIGFSGTFNAGNYSIATNVSSQFASGLLFALSITPGESTLTLTGKIESRPYIDLTLEVLKLFGAEITEINEHTFRIIGKEKLISPTESITAEGDWSNAAFWLGLSFLLTKFKNKTLFVSNLNTNSTQGDKKLLEIFELFGVRYFRNNSSIYFKKIANTSDTNQIISVTHIPDLVPVLATVAAFLPSTTSFIDAQRLRIKESDRLESTSNLLRNFGAIVSTQVDSLKVEEKICSTPKKQDSFNDHRIVMACVLASIFLNKAVLIKNANSIDKSYPEFFSVLTHLGAIVTSNENSKCQFLEKTLN